MASLKEPKATLPIAPERIAEIRKKMVEKDVIEKEIDLFKVEIWALHNELIGTPDCAKSYDLNLFTALIVKGKTEVLESIYKDTIEGTIGDTASELFSTKDIPEVVDLSALVKAMIKNKINPNHVLEVKLKKGFEPSVLAMYDTGKEDSPVKVVKALIPKEDFFKTCYVMWKTLSKAGKDLVKSIHLEMFNLTLKKI